MSKTLFFVFFFHSNRTQLINKIFHIKDLIIYFKWLLFFKLEDLSNQTAKLKHDLEELQKKKRAAENRLLFLKNDISENENKLQKACLDVNFCQEQLKSFEHQLHELQQNVVTVDPKQVDHLDSNLTQHQQAYNHILHEFQIIEKEVKTLEDKIKAMGADKVQNQQSLINAAKKNLDDTNSTISKAQV